MIRVSILLAASKTRASEMRSIWLPPQYLREAFRHHQVAIDAMQTGSAIRVYNIMVGERRRVAAALIAVA